MNIFAILLLNVFVTFYAPNLYAQNIIGWLENITLINQGQQLTIAAKIDSGADYSSIHAVDIEIFQKVNQDWIKFKTINDFEVEAPLYRYTQIKTKKVGFQDRPVVKLEVCIGDIRRVIEVNLVDREHFSRPMLVGREALSGFLIDPTKTDLLELQPCTNKPASESYSH
ncbi:hypothetical protein THMIRHAM_00370 [Thiomicrorhabdus immobilis]|uniref:Retropepsin-like aspartic endopeptidase domain-containing protein n=1 Tax=Thiomicrorhabdus immobilis TaxID=2791037 RepID=A0ABM7MA83_9GAMM|nr:RimK/LysX family protein [Thiomicrorhabdus immobilis]BCN92252.1 hypothetical protein THMIRHAM_00370 [Thiomicrorhabdus immobilis]